MFVCVVDLGSFSCRALCLAWEEPRYRILGLVEIPSSGVVQGEVVNTEKAKRTLFEALRLLESESQIAIREMSLVYSGVTLGYLNSLGVTGTTPMRSHNEDSASHRVTEDDINQVLSVAAKQSISADFERLHEIPRCYKLDGKIMRREDILGSNGIRLEVEVHIITCLKEAVDNLIEISRNKPIEIVHEIVHSSIAASYISLTRDELEQGCLLIDMGYGSTSFQYSFEGQPLITESLRLAGSQVTSDIAKIFEVSLDIAEQLKLERGICWPAFVPKEEKVIIPGGANSMAKEITLFELCEVLNARVEEIFELILGRLQSCRVHQEYIQSVVLIGGTVLLSGMSELAEEIFGCPARLGLPDESLFMGETKAMEAEWKGGGLPANGRSPQYTSLFGLALYWLEEERSRQHVSKPPQRRGGGFLDWLKRKLL
ncbi:MAG: cell division protein FtsA [Spirochaetota bacterium]